MRFSVIPRSFIPTILYKVSARRFSAVTSNSYHQHIREIFDSLPQFSLCKYISTGQCLSSELNLIFFFSELILGFLISFYLSSNIQSLY